MHAMFHHRIAHELYTLKVPVIPRIISEMAHSRTGIDIHPGATIGRHFFIDTAPAWSSAKPASSATTSSSIRRDAGREEFPQGRKRQPRQGIKRHPNIEDDVIIYAGATILGGDVTVGKSSVIGGNTWLTKSVPPHSFITNREG